jgi:hypothetical protein
MCGGIEYQSEKIYFPQPGARLPVRLRDGSVTWIAWGRRKDEATGKFPNRRLGTTEFHQKRPMEALASKTGFNCH